MKVEMIYHTPELHKLVEAIARVCYQSYGKLAPDSHKMIKGIMNKGHVSVASSGNMVFNVSLENADLQEILFLLESLISFKEVNNFIRWSTPANKGAKEGRVLISMNMLTLLDIVKAKESGNMVFPEQVIDGILEEVKKVPYLHWFLDDTVEVTPSESPYIGDPSLGNPVILTEDYTALKELGLTDYELDIHATVTVDLITDRATGLQMWRHADMVGGCELSQRYVDRSTAVIREMEDIDLYPDKLKSYAEKEDLTIEEAKEHYDAVVQSIRNHYKSTLDLYTDLIETLKELGVNSKRAKEISRSLLPNAITTRIIQCRPLRQWKHFISLRETVHAQSEIRKDTEALKRAFDAAGIAY